MSGATFPYKYGDKNNWRRWMWNRIVERLPNRHKAVCVYLAGEQNLDQGVALSKGFKPWNLIAVERDVVALETIRGGGALAVGGDFFDAVDAIAKKHRIDVVFGDLTCGFERHMISRISNFMCHPNMNETVFAFNLLRGRDPSTNDLRDMSADFVLAAAGDVKHRGAHVLIHAYAHMGGLTGDTEIPVVLEQLRKNTLFDLSSYASDAGTQTFDSVVLRNPLSLESMRTVHHEFMSFPVELRAAFENPLKDRWGDLGSFDELSKLMQEHQLERYKTLRLTRAYVKTSRSASAILAHRTRRMA